jgi:hypothetical protein
MDTCVATAAAATSLRNTFAGIQTEMLQLFPDEYSGPFSEMDEYLRAARRTNLEVNLRRAEPAANRALDDDEHKACGNSESRRSIRPVESPLPPSSPPSRDSDSLDGDRKPPGGGHSGSRQDTGSDLLALTSSPTSHRSLALGSDRSANDMQDVVEEDGTNPSGGISQVETHTGHGETTEGEDALMEESQCVSFFPTCKN